MTLNLDDIRPFLTYLKKVVPEFFFIKQTPGQPRPKGFRAIPIKKGEKSP